MKVSPFSPVEVQEMAHALMAKGMHPKKVRTELHSLGILWAYQFLGQGRSERLRRLKRLGQNICPTCQEGKPIGQPLCDVCLAKKWAPDRKESDL